MHARSSALYNFAGIATIKLSNASHAHLVEVTATSRLQAFMAAGISIRWTAALNQNRLRVKCSWVGFPAG